MARKEGTRSATRVVQTMVQRSRSRAAFVVQAVCLALAAIFVWGWLGSAGYVTLAVGLLAGLAAVELLLLVLFLRQQPESDEEGVRPLADDAEQLVLHIPDGQQLVLDRKRQLVLANDGALRIPTDELRFFQVDDSGGDVRLLAATHRDLLVLGHLVNPLPREKADLLRLARRLARSAQVPFEES